MLMGKLSVDSENNQVGQMLAELAGMPQGTFAHALAVDGEWATVGREVDGGTADVKIKLPAIVTADLRLNEPATRRCRGSHEGEAQAAGRARRR